MIGLVVAIALALCVLGLFFAWEREQTRIVRYQLIQRAPVVVDLQKLKSLPDRRPRDTPQAPGRKLPRTSKTKAAQARTYRSRTRSNTIGSNCDPHDTLDPLLDVIGTTRFTDNTRRSWVDSYDVGHSSSCDSGSDYGGDCDGGGCDGGDD